MLANINFVKDFMETAISETIKVYVNFANIVHEVQNCIKTIYL